MKSKKKAPAQKPAPRVAALSPRQIALGQLYRVLKITGVLALVIGLIVAGSLYGHLLRPTSTGRMAKEERRVFDPKLNANTPSHAAPDGMVWIPGGEFIMGDEDIPNPAEEHLVYVDRFWLDQCEVSNEQFAQFVAATKYKTVVERPLDAREWPKAPPHLLNPWSLVFEKPPPSARFQDLAQCQMECAKPVLGACWKHPEGPGSTWKGREKHPVVHICYDDALAFCAWADKRLPTEAEWEFAARGGLDRKKFPWGDELKPNGKWQANVWQGRFPYEDTKEDGYDGTAPVASFAANGYGLHDMAGNVWEWCADFYQPDYYARCPDGMRNPPGPPSGYDPLEPGFPKRVQRGGSFLCAEGACERYFCAARGKGEINSSGIQIGFRCAKDAK